jgi:hypothetical protein
MIKGPELRLKDAWFEQLEKTGSRDQNPVQFQIILLFCVCMKHDYTENRFRKGPLMRIRDNSKTYCHNNVVYFRKKKKN